ncbi:MAG: AAA family ATPase, partial [Firmicutes bacterium]|nr:AAA family ATPase [Bacillota bacterium]
MLLEFRVTNYKSFREEFVFSLVPAPKQKGLDYSVMKMQAGNKEYKGLCSAVVYGPNASGKTNIIGAMNTFKSIVLRGNIRNDPKYNGANYAAGMLELIPNNASSKSEPVAFSITFIEAGLLIEYAFSMDLGAFLASGFKRKILLETLKVDKNLVFSRDEEMEFGSLDTVQEFLLTALEQNKPGAEAIARSGLNDEELFLTNGFKMIFSAKLVSLITDWIDKKFTVVCRADAIVSEPQISGNQKEPVYFEKTVNELAGRLGAPGALGYVIDSKNGHPRLYSWFKSKNNNKGRG